MIRFSSVCHCAQSISPATPLDSRFHGNDILTLVSFPTPIGNPGFLALSGFPFPDQVEDMLRGNYITR